MVLNISKPVLFASVIIAIVIIALAEVIQVVLALGFPSLYTIWSPIISSIPNAITSCAAVVALLQLLLILKQAKAREKIDDLIASYNLKRVSMASDRTAFGDHMVRTIRNLALEARFSSHEIENYFRSEDDDGRRLAGLSIVQGLASSGHLDQATSYFTQVRKVLEKPKRAHEHYHAILAIAGIDAIKRLEKQEKIDETKGIMFHLGEEQQKVLCEAVTNYKYHNDTYLTTEQWGRFEKLVYEQTWCRKT